MGCLIVETFSGGVTHSDNDGGIGGQLVRNVDVHLNVGWVCAEAGHPLQ